MGRRICPTNFAPAQPRGRVTTRRRLSGARALLLVLFALVSACLGFNPLTPAAAQAAASGAAQAQKQPDKMFVEADQLVYDKDKNTVSAVGNARIYYQGRTLQADKVIYDRNSGRVYATGHAKMINKDGNIIYGDVIDMTKDFKEGFVESLRSTTTAKTFFSAPHAEITQGAISVYNKGTYTACAACADNPLKPPLWRVRAKRIVHNNDEHMVYYTDAWLEFLGPAHGLHSGVLVARSDGHAQVRHSDAAIDQQFGAWLWRRSACLLGDGAELRLDLDADLFRQSGLL